jgi:hypothetical protein
MNTNGLVRFIVVGMVLLLVISVGMYFLFKPSTTSLPNEADINAIYQVVGEFGARLKDVPDSSAQSVTERIAMEGIGVNVVKGIRVFHTEDGRNIRIDKMPDGEEVVVIRELEATPLKDALEEQTGIVRSAMYSQTSAAVDSNLKRLMTDRLYNEFTTYADVVPGKPMSGPYPESIKIDSVQKLDDMSYAAKGDILLTTGNQILRGNAGVEPITLTLKKVNGTWLIDDVTGGPKA